MNMLLPIVVTVLLMLAETAVAEVGLRRLRLVEVTSHKDKQSSSSSSQQQPQQPQEKWPFEDANFRFLLQGSFSFTMSTPTVAATIAPTASVNTNSSPTSSPTKVSSPTATNTTATYSPTQVSSSTSFTTSAPSRSPAGNAERATLIQNKCGTSVNARSTSLATLLSKASDASLLSTSGKPQYEAKTWLDEVDGAILCPASGQEDRVLQRYRVALIYFALNGPQWSNCKANPGAPCLNLNNSTQTPNAWLSDTHECSWFGLDCGATTTPTSVDSYDILVGINLHSNNLAGAWPMELVGLTELTGLTVNDNQIAGTIPSEVAFLTSLQYLDLEYNHFSGTLPDTLYTLTSLLALGLGHNRFVGTVPNTIGQLTHLSILFLENTLFTGPVPTDGLFKLDQLVALTLDHSFFSGSLQPLCDVEQKRRSENNNTIYLSFLYADCAGSQPKVKCSCCTFCY